MLLTVDCAALQEHAKEHETVKEQLRSACQATSAATNQLAAHTQALDSANKLITLLQQALKEAQTAIAQAPQVLIPCLGIT